MKVIPKISMKKAESQNKLNGFEKQYWEDVWSRVLLPQYRDPRRYHELHYIFNTYLPRGKKISFSEIGCAPGSWMAYFSRNLGYKVSGLENAEDACEKTVENLRLLSVPAKVHMADFFEYEGETYDIVFTSGFIEHFKDVESVISRLVSFCNPGGYVVTIIPSLEGLNWQVSRHFRPRVAAGHFPITVDELIKLHERQGLTTLWSGVYGSMQIRPLFDNTELARLHPTFTSILNFPFKTWNRVVSLITRATGYYPQSKCLFMGSLYIGFKSK